MSDRDAIFASIRAGLTASTREPSALPDWPEEIVHSKALQDAADLEALFQAQLEAVAAKCVRSFNALDATIAEHAASRAGYVDPALLPAIQEAGALSGCNISTTLDRARIDDLAFGITRATWGIAETGTLVLTGSETSSRLGALAPWLHIAVLERARLVRSIPDAIARFGAERNIVFVTGPSKTGDVEGILIKGVHGPGVQVCCLVD